MTPFASFVESAACRVAVPALRVPVEAMRDRYGRLITDLRVSVTDRCNYRCVYCRTGNEGAQFSELRLDDYLRMIRLFVSLGVEKVRLTGGEPLLRNDLLDLVRELSSLRTLQGAALDLAVTTNGHMLASLAKPLKAAAICFWAIEVMTIFGVPPDTHVAAITPLSSVSV